MKDLNYNPNAQAELAEKIEANRQHGQQKWKSKSATAINMADGESALKIMKEQLEQAKKTNTYCDHLTTKGKEGEKGLWCISCGEKIYDMEDRKCGSCVNSKSIGIHGTLSCDKKSMFVIDDMKVTYKIKDGTCWQSSPPNSPANTEYVRGR